MIPGVIITATPDYDRPSAINSSSLSIAAFVASFFQ